MEVFGINLCGTAFLLTVFSVFISYLVYSYTTFWTRRNVYQVPFGLAFDSIKKYMLKSEPAFVCWQQITDHLKEINQKFGGFLMVNEPYILTTDSEILKDIMNTYYSSNFHGRGLLSNEKIDPLSCNILNLEGPKWKTVRTKLSPTFTTAKLRTMFETVEELSKNIEDFVKVKSEADEDFDIKKLAMTYSCDAFASCAFGLECNSLKNPETEFMSIFSKIFTRSAKDTLRLMFIYRFTKLAELLNIKQCDPVCTNFFIKLVRDVVTYRKENNVIRNDFIQMLMDEMDPNKSENPFTFTEAAAQAFVMFLAAFETTSTALTFCLYEMCVRQDLQDKVRNEINDVIKKHNNQITYDACNEMTYLKQFVNETLRFYPPIPQIPRMCYNDYKVPGTNSIIPKNTKIIIPIHSIHHNPDYFSNPEVFDPERFSEENKANIAPYTFMPFGEGPRICIGMRFSQMQIPLVLSRLLQNYRFTISPKTKLPIVYDKTSAVSLNIVGGLFLNAEKIE